MCDPLIQESVDALVRTIRQNQPNQYGQPNQCMQRCQQQCQQRQQPGQRPGGRGQQPWRQPPNQPQEIENGQPAPGQGGWGQPRGRGGKLIVTLARGAHSSGGPINVFVDKQFAGKFWHNRDSYF